MGRRVEKKEAEDALKVENTGSRLIEVKYGEKLKKWLCARCSCWKWESPSQTSPTCRLIKAALVENKGQGCLRGLIAALDSSVTIRWWAPIKEWMSYFWFNTWTDIILYVGFFVVVGFFFLVQILSKVFTLWGCQDQTGHEREFSKE